MQLNSLIPMGLTTTKAPFIENARSTGELFIHQPYALYSADNQTAWKQLYQRILPQWRCFANQKFLKGVELIALPADHVPHLDEINQFLQPLTGFQAKAVSGYVPTYIFFDRLRQREFPTTITIRDGSQLDYLPEPDIFHDVAGHVPMHTDPTFADVLVKFGSLAEQAVQRQKNNPNPVDRIARIKSAMQALSRFFWFTIEFGLLREAGKLKVYGSGLLSSASEIEHCIVSPHVQRVPFQLEWVVNQGFEIDHFQTLLFYVDSFEHLFEEVRHLEEALQAGRLDFVSPGEPDFGEAELAQFLI